MGKSISLPEYLNVIYYSSIALAVILYIFKDAENWEYNIFLLPTYINLSAYRNWDYAKAVFLLLTTLGSKQFLWLLPTGKVACSGTEKVAEIFLPYPVGVCLK